MAVVQWNSDPASMIAREMTEQYGSPIRSMQREHLWKLLSWHGIDYEVDCTRDQAISVAENLGRKWPEDWMPGPPRLWRIGDPKPGEETVEQLEKRLEEARAAKVSHETSSETDEVDIADMNMPQLRQAVKAAGLEQTNTDTTEVLRERLVAHVNQDTP